MCGRYVIFSTPEAIRALFRYGEQPNFPPRYNIAPTQPVPIVRLVDGKRSFALMRCGLLPSWVEEPKSVGGSMQHDCNIRRTDFRRVGDRWG
jgi:putative SOS response-associated peptidase YedK